MGTQDTYNTIAIYHEDYLTIKARLAERKGIKMMGLIHELLQKTEPPPRTDKGTFTKREANK
jgi:hypothetical protein